MEQFNHKADMLDLLTQPAFYVNNGVITRVNPAAAQKQIEPDSQVSTLLLTGADEYAAFQGGELYLSVTAEGTAWGASVTRIDGNDVFVLEQPSEQAELHAMSLAAQELRDPLSTIMTVSERLFSSLSENPGEAFSDQLSAFNQGIYKMLRLIGNMSYAEKYNKKTPVYNETCNIRAYFDELSASAAELISLGNRTLVYNGPDKDIFCLVNKELLERAYYNLLSNAVKFSPENASIRVTLSRNKSKLYLTVENPKDGYTGKDFFTSFLRDPGICDGRCGIGLGMVLIRSAAYAHGGTVLVEQTDAVTRVTLTMSIKQNNSNPIRSHILTVDYAGERDHRLVELSDALPFDAYEQL